MTDPITADLVRDEAYRRHAYKDSEGFLTIGIGRLCDKRFPNSGLTRKESEYLLENDIRRCLTSLDKSMPWWRQMPGNWQRGLLNMRFNLGLPKLRLFKRMLAALKRGDGKTASKEALDSDWAGQVGARAKRIAKLYRGD